MLQLNRLDEYIRIDRLDIPFFRVYGGKYAEQMHQLIDDDRIPMNTAQLMQRRISVGEELPDWFKYFNTPDLKAQKGDEIKLVLTTYADGSTTPLGRKYLELINPQETLINGAVNLELDNRYEALQGEGVIAVKESELAERINCGLSKEQAGNSLLWRVLLRHPDAVPNKFVIHGLHKEAIDYTFKKYKEKFAPSIDISDLRIMGVFIGSCTGDKPEMRAWVSGGSSTGIVLMAGAILALTMAAS